MDGMSENESASAVVARLSVAYGELAGARDVAGFVALYAPDAVINDLFTSAPIVGRDVWRTQVQAWFDSIEDGDSNVAAVEPLTVLAAGDLTTEAAPESRTGGWLVRLPVRAGGVRTLAG